MEMLAGNEALMTDYEVRFDEATLSTLDSWKDQAKSVVLAAANDPDSENPPMPAAIFSTSDPIRAESHSVITSLRARGGGSVSAGSRRSEP